MVSVRDRCRTLKGDPFNSREVKVNEVDKQTEERTNKRSRSRNETLLTDYDKKDKVYLLYGQLEQ